MTTHYLAESGGIAPKTTPCWLRNVRALIRRRMRPHLLLWTIAICLVGEQTGTAQNAATPQLLGTLDGISFYSTGFAQGDPKPQLLRALIHHRLAWTSAEQAMTLGIRRAQKFPIKIYCCADRAFLEVTYAVITNGEVMEGDTIAVASTQSKPPDTVTEVSVLFQVGADPKKWHDLPRSLSTKSPTPLIKKRPIWVRLFGSQKG